MKITPSKDGEPRAILKIIFRLAVEDFVNAITFKIADEWGMQIRDSANRAMTVETALKSLCSSRAKILKDVERAHREDGMTLWARAEDCASAEIVAEIKQQARTLVLKKFPAFKKPL